MDKIEKQVKRHREKVKDKKSASNTRPPRTVGINILSYDRSEGENAPRIIKSERYLAKPMYLDEAVMQLDVLDNEFLVFTNAESETINVLYKRKDGDYGLIEPEPK
jgi:putative sigma-54 modulation protein